MVNESQIRKALEEYPDLAETVVQAQGLPPKEGDYKPKKFEILFEGVLVSSRQEGQQPFDLMLPVDCRPNVIEMYGDEELLLVKAGDALLLNRLPENLEWNNYATN